MRKIVISILVMMIIVAQSVVSPFFTAEAETVVEQTTLDVIVNQDFDLREIVVSGNLIVECSSSNSWVAKVSDKGIITPKRIGGATITVTDSSGNIEEISLNVKSAPEALTVCNDEVSLQQGETFKLVSYVSPSEACTTVTYSSSDKNVATVDENGNIKAKQPGQSIITVETLNGIRASCTVTVTSLNQTVSFSSSSDLTLYVGESSTREATSSSSSEDVSITYTSEDEEVATVNADGKITGRCHGVTYITATDGQSSATIRVNVVETEFSTPINNVPMMVGKSFQAFTEVNSIFSDVTVTYYSDNEEVVTVDENGKLTAIAVGEAMIYMYTSDGQSIQVYDCTVSDEYFSYGIDVSRYQGSKTLKNWQDAKAYGIDFAILRIGSAGSMDSQFRSYYTNAKAAGIEVGAYHYVTAVTVEEALQQAETCLQWLQSGNYQFEYPIMMDFETDAQKELSVELQSEIIDTYCSVLSEAGYCVVVYGYANMMKLIDEEVLEKYAPSGYLALWMAHYGADQPGGSDYEGNIVMWQYTSGGKIDGFSTRVDLDLCYFDYPSYIKSNHLNGY